MINVLFKDNHALVFNVKHLSIEVDQEIELSIPGAFKLYATHDSVLQIEEGARVVKIKALETGTAQLEIIYCTGPLNMAKQTASIRIDVTDSTIVALVLHIEKAVSQ